MIGNYLNVELVATAQKQISPAENSITIVTDQKQSQIFDGHQSIVESIHKVFLKKETKIIVANGDSQNFIVVIPERTQENLRLAGASIYSSLKKEQVEKVQLVDGGNLSMHERSALLEGLLLSSYEFTKYKKDAKKKVISITVDSENFPETMLSELNRLNEAVSLTKTMVNEPPNYMDALKFAEYAVEAGTQFGFKTEILHKAEIETLKMGGILAVNKGSETPPTFNIFHYQPENAVNEKPLVLVGKGVTFDTGGYSIKVGGNMSSMKSDMAGGAAVLGIVSAAAANQLPYHIIGLVSATDNKISSNALVVDDVITMMDGTTVEVQNTDAEGRLVLADALTYAQRFNPELVIDMATLTGAAAAITGPFGIAMAGNSKEQMDNLKVAGEEVYERLVQLPFWKEFEDLLKSDIADLKNIGGPVGGSTTAAKFLEHFTDYPWIHLDIAGAAFVDKANGYRQSGSTGVAVRLLYQFIKSRCSK